MLSFSPPFFFISFLLYLYSILLYSLLFSSFHHFLSVSVSCNCLPCGYLLFIRVCTLGGNLCHCLTVQSKQRSIDQTCLQVLLQQECPPSLLIHNSHLSFNWRFVMPARMPYDCCWLPHKHRKEFDVSYSIPFIWINTKRQQKSDLCDFVWPIGLGLVFLQLRICYFKPLTFRNLASYIWDGRKITL